jgi:hypothetical protein
LLTLHLFVRLAGGSPGTAKHFEPFISHIAGKGKREIRRIYCQILTRSWTETTIGADNSAMRIDCGRLFEKADKEILVASNIL